MSEKLTLEQIETISRWTIAHDTKRPEIGLAIEYAKERAARELCESLWDGEIDTDQHGGKVRAWAWHGSTVQQVKTGPTFTDAYLALAAKLREIAPGQTAAFDEVAK